MAQLIVRELIELLQKEDQDAYVWLQSIGDCSCDGQAIGITKSDSKFFQDEVKRHYDVLTYNWYNGIVLIEVE